MKTVDEIVRQAFDADVGDMREIEVGAIVMSMSTDELRDCARELIENASRLTAALNRYVGWEPSKGERAIDVACKILGGPDA